VIVTVYLRSKENAVGKALIAAFEAVQKAHSQTLSVSLQMTILNDDHAEPHVCVTDARSGQIVNQCFNFVDHLGGKTAVTADNVEKWLVMRGIVQPTEEQLKEVLKTQKARETP